MNRHLDKVGLIKVGVECCIKCGNKLLLQRRPSNSSFFPNCLAFPGGHVDEGEDVLKACIREVSEETGIDISKGKIRLVINTINNHKDKGIVWIIYGFSVELKEEIKPIESDEGVCEWYEISKLDRSEIVPPVLVYFDDFISSKNILFTSGIFSNNEVVTGTVTSL
jgi:8-oxo-dGTP diphosphatase